MAQIQRHSIGLLLLLVALSAALVPFAIAQRVFSITTIAANTRHTGAHTIATAGSDVTIDMSDASQCNSSPCADVYLLSGGANLKVTNCHYIEHLATPATSTNYVRIYMFVNTDTANTIGIKDGTNNVRVTLQVGPTSGSMAQCACYSGNLYCQ